MHSDNKSSIHWSFWVVGLLMLIWNIMGILNFFMQMNANTVLSFPESHQAIINGRPLWATGGFAIAVFAGAIGCLLLLLKKSFSLYVFILSFIGVNITMIHTINIATSVNFSSFEILMMILSPLISAAFLIWYAKLANTKNWLR